MAYEESVDQQQYSAGVTGKCNEAIQSAKNNIENKDLLDQVLAVLNGLIALIKNDIREKWFIDYCVGLVTRTYNKVQTTQTIGIKLEEYRTDFRTNINFIQLLKEYETVCRDNNLDGLPNDTWKRPYQELRVNIKQLTDFIETNGIIGVLNNPESFKNLIIKWMAGTLLPDFLRVLDRVYTDLSTWVFLRIDVSLPQPFTPPQPAVINNYTNIENKVKDIRNQIAPLKKLRDDVKFIYERMREDFKKLGLVTF
jgi:hypothetical protein